MNPLHYPHDRALSAVLLSDGNGEYFLFQNWGSLKERFEAMAHYSGYGLKWRIRP